MADIMPTGVIIGTTDNNVGDVQQAQPAFRWLCAKPVQMSSSWPPAPRLQQAWMSMTTGKIEWRDIDVVFE